MNDVVGLILSFAVAMLALNLIIIRFEINKLEEDIKRLTAMYWKLDEIDIKHLTEENKNESSN